ncbi:MAG: endonuclease III [Lachnospiraceae bacterium]|nr:endonuclease III [Lachnospiraceae bacterium]
MLETLDNWVSPGMFLEYGNAWQLLFATILSAQCTDDRVNIVTRTLFVKYPDLRAFADADLEELEEDIRSTGFYHNKAKNLISCAKSLIEKHDGVVPSDIDELTSLAGVGRKTANVVRGNIFGIPSIVVDTHVGRIARRTGLSTNTDPEKVEYDLMKRIPKDHWIAINTQFITLGRKICKARKAECENCPLAPYCPKKI